MPAARPRARSPRSPRRSSGPAPGAEERLLESALVVFAERGFDGATTRDIAAHARVNLGLVQYYFGGKEKLWRAALDRAFAAFWSSLEGAVSDTSGDAAALAEIVRVAVRFAAGHPALVRVMNDEGRRDGPRLRWLVDRHGRRLYDLAAAALARMQPHGILVDVAAVHLYYVFIGAAGMIFSQAAECRRLTGTDPTTSPAMVEAHADALVRLFLGGGLVPG